MIKEQYEKGKEFKWNLVKGTLEKANETIEECIIREVKEEVGLNVKGIELKRIYQYRSNDNLRLLFVLYIKNPERKARGR